MKLSLSDRIKFSFIAIKEHGFLLTMGIIFFAIGCVTIYLGIKNDNNIVALIAGGFVTLFMGFFLGATMPSSLSHYYEKEVIKKYGGYTTAIVTKKHIEDLSYEELVDNKANKIELLLYCIDYTFTYHKEYTNSFIVTSKTCFDAVKIGSDIPIKFLKHKPEKAEPRRQKLCNDLGLENKACS